MTLEELLNKLIEKGWKPFGRNYCKYENGCLFYIVHTKDGVWSEGRYGVSLRELTSKESLLRQFVCENGMVKTGRVFISWTKNANCDDYGNLFWDKACPKDFYEYRLIEASLKDESELEEFLLDNIKIDG